MNKYTINKLPKSKVEIKAEIPAETLAEFTEKALDAITKETEIAGFRKGAAPKETVKSKVGEQKILDRAAMMAVENSLPEAIGQNSLEPLGYPEISILKLATGNPLEYKAVVAVYPQTNLPDYKKIASEFVFKAPEVTDEDIKRLKMEKERRERENWRADLLEKIAAAVELEIPDVLIQTESQKTMADFKQRVPQMTGMDFGDYLKKMNKTESQVNEEIAKDSAAKIKNFLILQEIAKKEKVEIKDEEVSAALAKTRGENKQEKIDPAQEEKIKGYLRQNLETEKVFELLENSTKKS
jgi:FKBP-type peptidyl-prolyl cis-trans isomerase (trigger factor)